MRKRRIDYAYYAKRASGSQVTGASPAALWEVISAIGGDNRYYYLNSLWTVREIIEMCPDEAWGRKSTPAGTPVRQVYHILGGLDIYCVNRKWGWDPRFKDADGHYSWTAELKEIPTRPMPRSGKSRET